MIVFLILFGYFIFCFFIGFGMGVTIAEMGKTND